MISKPSILLLTLCALLTAACAEVPTDPEERAEFERMNDPLEPMNRKIFAFNNYLDENVMEPVARGYRKVLPDPVQTGVHNFLINLTEPYVAGNEILQGRFTAATTDLGRFIFNTIFGLGGLFDFVSDTGGPKANSSDIGITFGTWGIGEGPYLMLPFFGPSNPRDAAGRAADFWADPVDAVIGIPPGTNWAVDTRMGFDIVDTRVQLLEPIADLKRSALDYYASVRSLYRQRRRAAISGGRAPEEEPTTPGGPLP